jgi:hypothetical protein
MAANSSGMDTRGFVTDRQQNRLNRGPGRDRFCGVMDHAQLELFADRRPTPSATNSGATRRLVPEHLSDATLIAALPEASLAEGCALAAEAGRRRLGDAVRALVALCNRFVGFGVDCRVPEQVAALEALCIILKAAVGAEFSCRLRAASIPGCVSLVSDAEERVRDDL